MKRTMKKAMSILAASAVLALTLAGCGGTDTNTTENTENTETASLSGTVATNGSTSMEGIIGNSLRQTTAACPSLMTPPAPALASRPSPTAPPTSACPPVP